MSNLVSILLYLAIGLMIGLMIEFAVDNYHDGYYFWFGFDIFVVIQWMLILIRLTLYSWGVEFNA